MAVFIGGVYNKIDKMRQKIQTQNKQAGNILIFQFTTFTQKV